MMTQTVKINDPDLLDKLKEIINRFVSYNCICGVDESGEWNEELMEKYGCECYEIHDLPVFVNH